MKTKEFILTLALIAVSGIATAQTQSKTQTEEKKQVEKTTQTGPAFVDKNNNGVCDNYENGTPGNPNSNGRKALRNGTGSGNRTGYGMRNGRGRNFVDANKNGVCDHYENGTSRQGRGQGYGRGIHNGRGYHANYVDKNNNGICDYREAIN